jgi:hypothetical protein
VNDILTEIATTVRRRMARLLEEEMPTRETARLLAEIEDEQERHERVVADLARRADELDSGPAAPTTALPDRPHPPGVDPRAATPWRGGRDVTPAQAARGVVYAYATANPTFFRALIDRLEPGEKVRNITSNHGNFEYSKEEFLATLPDIAASASYRTGTTSAPGACRYVTGNPSPELRSLKAPD